MHYWHRRLIPGQPMSSPKRLAIALDPHNVSLYVDRSFAYGAAGEFARAQVERRHFVQLDTSNGPANLQRSLTRFNALAEREPNNVHAYLNIGDLQLVIRQYETALKSFE
jgi:tetratricopeptide (TPR) repeat protein